MSTKGFMLRMSPELHERILAASKAQNRSINAEINARLEASFLEGTLGRLRWLCDQMKDLLGSSAFSPSVLAEGIGEDTPSRLDRILAGLEEPAFKMLDAIADYCCANAGWLKHGMGNPFHTVSPAPDCGMSFCGELLNPLPLSIHIVRADTAEGQVVIVKKLSDRQFVVHETAVHMCASASSLIVPHQVQFLMTCGMLFTRKIRTLGYIAPFDSFRDIAHGKTHPLLALKELPQSNWVRDWVDFALSEREGSVEEHWDGFGKMLEATREGFKGGLP